MTKKQQQCLGKHLVNIKMSIIAKKNLQFIKG